MTGLINELKLQQTEILANAIHLETASCKYIDVIRSHDRWKENIMNHMKALQ